MSARSLSHRDRSELTNDCLESTNEEQSISPNPEHSKWSVMSSMRRSQHSGSVNTPSTSFLSGRLFSRGEIQSPPSAATNDPPMQPVNIFTSPNNRWMASDRRRKSAAAKADQESAGRTIDEALRSLYDENHGVGANDVGAFVKRSSQLWWTLDEEYCYTKEHRDTKTGTHPPEHDHPVRPVDEHWMDDMACTSQLYEELHADPLASVLDRCTDVNPAASSQNDDATVVDTNVQILVEEDDDDFGDFQSAVGNDTAVSLQLEEYDTGSECVEVHSSLANPPGDVDPNGERLPEEALVKPVVLTLSLDDCDNDTALVQYVDSLCRSPAKESASISASPSMDTPDLVRMVEEVIQSSYEMGTLSVPIEAEPASLMNHKSHSSRSAIPLRYPESIVIGNDSVSTCQNGIASSMIEDQTSLDNRGLTAPLPPLSMMLPVGNNLSTLEARFTRRLQQQYFLNEQESKELAAQLSDDSSSRLKNDPSDLPPYYFTSNDVDDTISVLQSLPWQHVPLTSGELTGTTLGESLESRSRQDVGESLAFWDEHITSRLCQLDNSLEHIQSETLLHVQPFQPTLIRANDLMHEWDQNLRLAYMYWERSKHALSGVMGSEIDAEGLVGATLLLKAWEEQEDYQVLDTALDELDDIRQKEKELLQQVDRFDVKDFNASDKYWTVLQLAKVLEDRVSNGRLANLRCLDSFRERLQNVGFRFWNRLLDITRSFVVHSCKTSASFDWDEYERLFRAFLDLKSHGIVNLSPDSGDMHSSWTDNILAAFAYEVDAAFTLALLYPTDCSSHHENDAKRFADELDLCRGDYSKLRAITHDLVNVRFELEWKMNCLPCVIHQLCKRLTDILHSYFSFVQWHGEVFNLQSVRGSGLATNEVECNSLRCVHDNISCYSPKLWEHCESIIAKCLDEYLNFSQKRSLFHRRNDGVDDTLWHDDLNCNYMVNVCVNSFLSFKPLFLGTVNGSSANNEVPTDVHSMISDKLSKVFGRHLRLLHVEAMNTVGRCLANETWILGSMAPRQLEPGQTNHSNLSIQTVLSMALHSASIRHNRFSKMSLSEFSGFEDFVNPFDSSTFMFETEPLNLIFDDSDQQDGLIHEKLCRLRSDQDGAIRLAPDAVTKELIAWLARLLRVMERLPLIAENACQVIINLCDLYFATVFRLCSGSSISDRLILGVDSPSPVSFSFDDERFLKGSTEKMNGTPMFASFRSSQQKTMNTGRKNGSDVSFPVCLDGEICFPIPQDVANIHKLQIFIRRAQTSLRHVVNLDMVDSWLNDPNADSPEEKGSKVARVLAKRQGAIWSCFTVAALVRLVVNAAKGNMSSTFAPEDFLENKMIALQEYCDTLFTTAPALARAASQIACTRAIEGSSIVKEILHVGVGWEECKLHEYPNDYVDDLCNRCSLIWGYLYSSSKLPTAILEETWDGLVSAAYLALLEGYSRVRRCSTEGRAHMTLDLASFRAGISPRSVSERLESLMTVNRPPAVNPELGSLYVETYIKAFYYPKEDIFAWIKQHWNQYKMNHVLALAVASILSCSDPLSEIQVNSMLDDIKALYHVKHGV
jgi:Protein of unknown function C-terminus (DUF2451)